jgi:uroporphyrinogen-III synthase
LKPLAGRAVLVTRPQGQAAGLAALIESAGGRALRHPSIAIEPLRSVALDALLDALVDEPGRCHLAVFISRNAVEQGLARLRERGRAWPPVPPGPAVAAIGAGTRRALEAEGFANVIAPRGPADSEALLAEPALGGVAGKRIVIFRGAGGREALAGALRERGASVEYAECYRRVAPAADLQPLAADWARGGVHAVAVSSGEGLANLAALLGEDGRKLLASTPLFVPHSRVAEQARSLGATEVVVAGSADEEVVAALVAYFGRAG